MDDDLGVKPRSLGRDPLLVALAWTAVLRVVSTLADMAGTDLDGAGLVPAAMSAERGGVKLLVMARHEMERVER